MAEIIGDQPGAGRRRLTSSIPASQALVQFAAELIRLADETMKPESLSIWLRPDPGHRNPTQ